MIPIVLTLWFLATGIWQHGRGLTIALFLIFLGFETWDAQRLEPRFTPFLVQVCE